jgi:phosphatidate cytidylyltransferase
MFWPMKNHFLILLFACIFLTVLGSYEITDLVFKKGIKIRRWFLPVLNTLIFVFSYIYAHNIFNIHQVKGIWLYFFSMILIFIAIIYARDIFHRDLTYSFEKMAYTLFGLLYIGIPSFLLPYVFNISYQPVHPVPGFYGIESYGTLTGSLLVLLLIVLVWANDIFAYVFGMLLGRNNIIGLTVSPKKSYAGYIGGFLSTAVFLAIYYFLFNRFIDLPVYLYGIFWILSGIMVPVGDLVESVFKRSANVKDSGEIIMGRGGILDSLDTVIYFYPFFFLVLQIYLSFRVK